ncbi:MAG: hypothetical protein J0M29_09505 [Chitinophagales bacterium]|nr:hypothetical protein [Chitinophagales bacterium]HLP93477.1 hypothetical protein [Saprospiraceae bacterium]
MKNKALAFTAAILLSAGIAFAFVGSSQPCCASGASAQTEQQACCGDDQPCCDIPCCAE